MRLAHRSGQPFSDLLTWDPRDVDTLWRLMIDDLEQQQQQQRQQEEDARFAELTSKTRAAMGR